MLSTIEDCLARLEASVDGRLARLEAATGLAVPVVQETGTTTDDEKLDKISDLVASLEQKVESNQESVVLIGDKLGEIVSCLAEAKSEASAAREIQTAQLVEAKAANRQRAIAWAILMNRQVEVVEIGDFSTQKFEDVDVILKCFQRGQTAVVPQARSYSCNAPQNDEEVISFFVDAIHELTGTKPITKQDGSDCIISYPE